MKTMKICITGTTPLLMHNSRLANPFDKFAQKLSELNKDKKRKGVDKLAVLKQMADTEWKGGLYHGETDPVTSDVGPYIPSGMIHACIQQGAKISRGGRTVSRALTVLNARNTLNYTGPRTLKGMLAKSEVFMDQRIVKVGMAKVLRTRPVFHEWSFTAELAFSPEVIDQKDLLKYIEDAGAYEGLGDGRSKGMGRFTVEVLN